MAVRTAYVPVADTAITADNHKKFPGGWIGYVEVTADQGSITTAVDLTSLTLTVTVGTSRKVNVRGKVESTSTVADSTTVLGIRNGAGTQLQRATVPHTSTATYTLFVEHFENPSSGSNTYKLNMARGSGTGTLTMGAAATQPAFIVAADVGPAA